MSSEHYATSNGRSIPKLDVNLSPASNVLANGVSNVVELGEKRALCLTQIVTTQSGDTHDTTIETSRDGVNNWYSAGAFTQVAASQTNNTQRKTFICDRFVRASFVVTGAPTNNAVDLRGEAV